MKVTIGLGVAFAIGVVCRLTGVPLPAPSMLVGAVLVLAMSGGYMLTNRIANHREARNRRLCGGPTGETLTR